MGITLKDPPDNLVALALRDPPDNQVLAIHVQYLRKDPPDM
jgi:hypothetical protein